MTSSSSSSPHSDPSTPSQSQVSPNDKAQLDINQWNAVLDSIRANLNLIVSTWGRGSRQDNEARGVMLAYLEENLGRMRDRRGGSGNDGGEVVARESLQDDDDVEMSSTVEKGIEELLGELKI